ncbi:hypothetical protein QWY84_04130 [Aquisalimonas lutea]|uniref:hypothetical protein n=1 Tax=Aquisalimonas lutea TaxID=1327750 RepID=UPI0025B4763E|nr:hypothetical protein [Aquisalimonas lutea]MDN3516794.1 hypothetical protein [Aquisalimonas lutea]
MRGYGRSARATVLGLVLSASLFAADRDPGDWHYAMEGQLLRDRVRVLIDGETALEAHMRFFGGRREARAEGRFRGRSLVIRCTRNPLVDALSCWIRVDGEVRSNHVVMQ